MITNEDLLIWIKQRREEYDKEHREAVQWRDWPACEFILHDIRVLDELTRLVEQAGK